MFGRTDIVGETGLMRLEEMAEVRLPCSVHLASSEQLGAQVGVCGSECATLSKACQVPPQPIPGGLR